ncbi:MAG: ABC transporter substrate-binding protein [Ardenticatenaceae bacterium]|nr:ABC transporter substrate-binding protein [Ardenticatenaceae bacterium]HBY97068.1 hypothetical protein [Chloroflexota bacterium]
MASQWDRRMSRRALLRQTGLAGAGLTLSQLLAACRGAAGPAPAVTSPVADTAPTAAVAPRRNAMRIGMVGEPANLDPFLTTTTRQGEVLTNIFAPLVELDYKTLQPAPALAAEWSQPDPLVWRFKLHEGVQFHKGYGEVTAEDVAFNANYTIEKDKPRKFLYFFVEGAEAVDKYTVDFKLSKPFTPFLVTTAVGQGTWVVSKKAYEEMGEDAFGRNPVGAGPFEFVSWESGSNITLKKFDKYWRQDRPYLDELIFQPVEDANIKKLRLLNGELDFIDQPDYKDIPELQANPNITVASTDGWSWNALAFNLRLPPDHPVMKREARRAIAYAIDREELAQSGFYGGAIPMDDPLPKGFLGTNPSVDVYGSKANLAQAREELAKAGLPNGFTVSALVDQEPAIKRQMEIIASQLAKVGIQVKIELAAGDVLNRMIEGNFEMGSMDITVMTPDSDSALYWFQHSETIANFGYQNEEVDRLLDQARQEIDPQKRAQMYSRVVQLVLEDAPYVYTVHRGMVWAYNKDLTGFTPPPQDYNLVLENVRWET